MATDPREAIVPPRHAKVVGIDPAWANWQHEIVAAIRGEFRGLLDDVEVEDIDWDAWRFLYEQGTSPRAAVMSACGRIDKTSAPPRNA